MTQNWGVWLLAFQGLTTGVYWIMVPDKLRWSKGKTYLMAQVTVFICYLPNIPFLIYTDTLGKALEQAAESPWTLLLKFIWMSFTVIFLSWIISKDTVRRRLTVGICHVVFLLITEMLLDVVIAVLLQGNITQRSTVLTIGQALMPIVFLMLSAVFAVYWNGVEKTIRRKIIALSLLLTVSQCFFMFGMWKFDQNQMEEWFLLYILLCSTVAVAADFLIYDTVTSAVAAQRNQMELEQLKQQQKTEYQYYQLVQANAQEMANYRHDFKNQLQVIYSLLNSGQEATQMLEELNERISSVTPVTYCASPVVNAIVTVKAEEARRRGITFQAAAEVDNWNMLEIDQSNLFSNLLDNALEGCLDGQPDQFITVKAGERKGIYAVQVRNSCDPALRLNGGRLLDTSKTDRMQHGRGLKILQSIAEKYHGELKLHCEDGVFTAEVFLEADS